MSGTSGLEFPPIPLIEAGEFGTIPAGAPATGVDPANPDIYYVNSFPATAMKYGIDTFFPNQFDCKPDIAVTGVNVGCKCDRSTFKIAF
jgi:5'-nucleotidase